MSTLTDRLSAEFMIRTRALRARDDERGAETTEWIFIVVGALVIGGIIIAAVTSFVQGQVAKLPGAE